MPRRLAHFSDPRLDAQIGELIKKYKELQKDIEQLERRLQKPIGLPDAMPPTEHEHGVADITDFPEAMPPTAHKASHAGGSDALTPADIGAETPDGAQARVDEHAVELVTQAGGMHGLEMESGTFTPAVQAATTAATVTHVVQQGYYIKVGKMVTCELFIRCRVTGGTGQLEVVDWPFTASNPRAGGVMLLSTLHGVGLGGMAIQYYTTNKCRIRKYDGNLIDISQVNDGKELDIQASITYQIA